MGNYYYAVDQHTKLYFDAPDRFANKYPGIFHPNNPFPHMVVMKNCQGYNFDIWHDSGNDIPPSNDYQDVTAKIYAEYKDMFKNYLTEKGTT